MGLSGGYGSQIYLENQFVDIYILSSGRGGRQTTWHGLPESIKARTKIVVPYLEREHYAKFPVLTHPDIIMDVTRTRQWLVQYSEGKIIMLDDDLTFATRRTDNPTTFVPATLAEIAAAFENINHLLDLYAHVGMSGREGANRNIERFVHTTRMMRVLCYDTITLRNNCIRYDRTKFMSDFDVTLQLLRKGFDNCVINYMVQNQYGSNAAGGCSQYRTPEAQEADARELKRLHPSYVKLVTKRTKTAWGWGERLDCQMQWKQAYKDSHA